MDLLDVGALLVAIVTAIGAIAAQRSAAKANKEQTIVSGRLAAESGAYERARKFDTETIEHQDREILELRRENSELRGELYRVRQDNEHLRRDLGHVQARLSRLEQIYPQWEKGSQHE